MLCKCLAAILVLLKLTMKEIAFCCHIFTTQTNAMFLSLKVPKCSTARVHQYLLTYQYVCLICIISSLTFFFLLSISVYHKVASYVSVQENNTEYIVKVWQKLYASECYCKGNNHETAITWKSQQISIFLEGIFSCFFKIPSWCCRKNNNNNKKSIPE